MSLADTESVLGSFSSPNERKAPRTKKEEAEHEKYKKAVDSWSCIPGPCRNVCINALKQADQSTPMILHRFTGPAGCTLSMILMLSLLFAFSSGFIYVLNIHYFAKCTEESGCKTCSVSLQDTNSQYTSCEPLSVNTLNVQGGCLSIPLKNNYDIVDSVISTAKSSRCSLIIGEGRNYYDDVGYSYYYYDDDIDLVRRRLSDNDDQYCSSYSYESEEEQLLLDKINLHLEIWDCFAPNKNGQVTDPDVDCIKNWANRGWLGQADIFDGSKPGQESAWVAYGIKALFSAVSLSCLRSSATFVQMFNMHPESFCRTSNTIAGGTGGFHQQYCPMPKSLNYTMFIGCGCEVSCPGIDIIGASAAEVTTGQGLGDFFISIPNYYLVTEENDYEIGGDDALSFEAVSAATGQRCASSSVMSAPPSLENGFYDCCSTSYNSAILAEANAFGALCMTTMVVFLTLIFLPIEFTIFRENETSQEKEGIEMATQNEKLENYKQPNGKAADLKTERARGTPF